MPQTIRQHRQLAQVASAPRRDLRALTGVANHDAHPHYTDESLRWEMERAARTELLPVVQPEPAMFCAVVEDEPRVEPIGEDFAIAVLAVATLVLLAIGAFWGLPA